MKHLAITSITQRVTLTLLCGTLLLLAVLGAYIWQIISQTDQESRTYALSMTDSMTDLLDDKTETVAKTASLLAQNVYVEKYYDATDVALRSEYISIFNILASNAISENPDILAVCLVDLDGSIITVGTLLDSVVLSTITKAYPEILDPAPFSPFYSNVIDLEGRLPYYAYVMPVYDTDNPTPMTRLATCILLCDLRQIQSILDQPLTNSFCDIRLVNQQNFLLCSRNDDLVHPARASEERHQPIGKTGWTLQCVMDFSTFSIRSASLDILWTISLLCLVLMIGVGVVIRYSLAKPVDSIIVRLQTRKNLSHMGLHFNNELDIIVDTIERTFAKLEKDNAERLRSETKMYAMQLLLRESEFSALQSQINPHFLYNTLECIRSIGVCYDIPEIVTISTSMADIFRYSIKGSSMVALRDELDIVRKYLSIIDIRFDNRFATEFDIMPESMACIIPKMTLQPIVENAIYHGLEPRKGKGRLTVRTRLRGNVLILVIEDNGIGIQEEDVAALNQLLLHPDTPIQEGNAKRSIGLINIARRIHLFSNGHCSMQLTSKPQEGTIVSVKLPAKTE
jgi:two-component system sensor histidine kinase YesM